MDDRFNYFKNKLIEHIEKLEKKNKITDQDKKEIKKSIIFEASFLKKSGFPVGTIREWKGKKYIKISPGKWRRKYTKEERGIKIALASIKKKIDNAKSSDELLQIVLENRDRFSDENGRPLPIIQELSNYVNGLEKDNKINNKKENIIKEPKTIKESKEEKEPKKEEPKINKDNFNKDTYADFKEVKETPKRDPDYISQSGSKYWYDKDGVYRKATHWGNRIASCSWFLDGKSQQAKNKTDEKIGYAKWSDFSNKNKDYHSPIRYLYQMSDNGKNEKSFDYYKKDKIDDLKDLMNDFEGEKLEELKEELKETENIDFEDVKNYKEPEYFKKIEGIEDIEYFENNKNEEETGIDDLREKYNSSIHIDGDDDEIYVGNETVTGKWKLVEAEAPSASHNENTFSKTKGFPKSKDGGTINDRDYEHDKAAQESVIDMANDFDGRALSFDSPIVVTKDGIVISGNNRTMSSKLAAKGGTDKKYIEALKKRAKKFGFSLDDIEKFKNPRVVFETDKEEDYSTKQFAKYNQSNKKAVSPIESAVKMSKLIDRGTVESIADKITEYDTLGELYADNKATREVFNSLIDGGYIQKNDLPQYYDNQITGAGKEFLETVLIGSVVNENNIRQLNTDGGRSIRQKLVRAIAPLVENKSMEGYSINKELNEAIGILLDVNKNKDTYKTVDDYSKQKDMFESLDPISVGIAKKMEGTQKDFANFMQEMNGGLRPASNGEVDMFFGGIESRDDILKRYIDIAKSFFTTIKSEDEFYCLSKRIFDILNKSINK